MIMLFLLSEKDCFIGELTAAITAAANMLAKNLTNEELELLGVTLTQLGDTIITIATQRSICEK